MADATREELIIFRKNVMKAMDSSQEFGAIRGMATSFIVLQRALEQMQRPPQLTEEDWENLKNEIWNNFHERHKEWEELQKKIMSPREEDLKEGGPPPVAVAPPRKAPWWKRLFGS